MMAPSHFPPNEVYLRVQAEKAAAAALQASAPRAPTQQPPAKPKPNVSGNAVVHGLASPKPTHVALPGEESVYEQFCGEVVAALAPAGAIELSLAQLIASDKFRLQRAHRMEQDLFERAERENSGPLDEVFLDRSTGIQNIALYANRIQRWIARNTAELQALQSRRKASLAQAQAEAVLLTQLALSRGETYDPALDFPPSQDRAGFVYSSPEIARLIDRAARLNQARVQFAPAPEARKAAPNATPNM